MVFTSPPWVPQLPYGMASLATSSPTCASLQLTSVLDPPDNISLPDFLYDPKYRVQKSDKSHTFVCGLSGKSIKVSDAKDRMEFIARALSKRTGWVPVQEETEWEKIACIYSINTVSITSSQPRKTKAPPPQIQRAGQQRPPD